MEIETNLCLFPFIVLLAGLTLKCEIANDIFEGAIGDSQYSMCHGHRLAHMVAYDLKATVGRNWNEKVNHLFDHWICSAAG
jgi:hypothetical protein